MAENDGVEKRDSFWTVLLDAGLTHKQLLVGVVAILDARKEVCVVEGKGTREQAKSTCALCVCIQLHSSNSNPLLLTVACFSQAPMPNMVSACGSPLSSTACWFPGQFDSPLSSSPSTFPTLLPIHLLSSLPVLPS